MSVKQDSTSEQVVSQPAPSTRQGHVCAIALRCVRVEVEGTVAVEADTGVVIGRIVGEGAARIHANAVVAVTAGCVAGDGTVAPNLYPVRTVTAGGIAGQHGG